MNTKHRLLNILGGGIFTLAFVLGTAFIVLTVWSDLEGNSFWGLTEAVNFNRTIELDTRLDGLTCPPLIAWQETATVVAHLENLLDQPSKVILQTDFSKPGAAIEPFREVQEFELGPNERRNLAWTVGMENLKYKRLILVRTYLIDPITRLPARTAHCGILVLGVDRLSGFQIILVSVIASLSGMALGIILWVVGKLPLKNRLSTYAMIALAGVTLAGMAATLTGLWIVAGGLLILNLVIIYSTAERMIQGNS